MSVRLELGIEIEIIVAQPFEQLEIFIMIDGADKPAEAMELLAIMLGGRPFEQCIQNVDAHEPECKNPAHHAMTDFVHSSLIIIARHAHAQIDIVGFYFRITRWFSNWSKYQRSPLAD